MINLKQTKLATTIFCLSLCQLAVAGDKSTKETPADSTKLKSMPYADAICLLSAKSRFQIIPKEWNTSAAGYPGVSSTSVASMLSAATPSQPMTPEQIDAKGVQEYGKDLGLSAKLADLQKSFKAAWK